MTSWTIDIITHIHVDVFVVEDSGPQFKSLRTANRVGQFQGHEERVECSQLTDRQTVRVHSN